MKNSRHILSLIHTIPKKYVFFASIGLILVAVVFFQMKGGGNAGNKPRKEMKSKELVLLTFDVPTTPVAAGDELHVPIVVENTGLQVDQGQNASAADIAVKYPVDILELVAITMPEKEPLMTVKLQEDLIDTKKGAGAFTYGVPPSGTFAELPATLAILTFKTKGTGSATLSFTKALVAATQVQGDIGKGESAVVMVK